MKLALSFRVLMNAATLFATVIDLMDGALVEWLELRMLEREEGAMSPFLAQRDKLSNTLPQPLG